MNPFEQHGIHHLSASSLNLARANMALWCLRYLHKAKGMPSAAMQAGIAGETGIAHGLFNPDASESECKEVAEAAYNKGLALSGIDADAREKKRIELIGREAEGRKAEWPGMVSVGLDLLRPYGIPSPSPGNGRKIEATLEGIPVPIIGFLDFAYDDHGFDIDLKTTGRMPEDMSADHILQGAIYSAAGRGNREQRFAYVTKTEGKVLGMTGDAVTRGLHDATVIAHTLKRALSLSADKDEVCAFYLPNYADFRWDSNTLARAAEVFRIAA